MRHKVSRLRWKPREPRRTLMRFLQLFQRGRGLDGRKDRSGLVAAETAEAGQLDIKAVEVNVAKSIGEMIRLLAGNIARETHGDVIVAGIDPMSAAKSGPQCR